MKVIKCNECGEECHKDKRIKLSGIASTRGGILLPDPCYKWDFCSQQCFMSWFNYHMGEPPVTVPMTPQEREIMELRKRVAELKEKP